MSRRPDSTRAVPSRFTEVLLFALLFALPLAADWPQWGQGPQHNGNPGVIAQPMVSILANIVYDPFMEREIADSGGSLLAHYQAPLVDGTDVYMTFKSGNYTSLVTWETQSWGVHKLSWQAGHLVDVWAAPSDWKPEPYGSPSFEPVFHPLIANRTLYAPGLGGTLLQISLDDGHLIRRLNPFDATDPTIYVSGPLTADAAGNIYYNTMKLASSNPWTVDAQGAWLVKVTPAGVVTKATFASLVPDAPTGNNCVGVFANNQLPWPPSVGAQPGLVACGAQRPGVNIAPAVAPDGTIYTVSRAHFSTRHAYLVAVNPNLTPKWAASLRNRLPDGCNVLIPAGGCRAGATLGVDPADNQIGSGTVIDSSTSSPLVTPDGSVIYGAYTRYNYAQGHLMKFSAGGAFLASYPFGWDTTPAIWQHDGTYSVVTKENRYTITAYCNGNAACTTARIPSLPQGYFITQLDATLGRVEWQYRSNESEACGRAPNGWVTCEPTGESGFEWCVNAPAVDARGDVYVNSEDGNLYQIAQGGIVRGRTFLQFALGAAYTPLAIGSDGMIYALNSGHLFAIGGDSTRRRAAKK